MGCLALNQAVANVDPTDQGWGSQPGDPGVEGEQTGSDGINPWTHRRGTWAGCSAAAAANSSSNRQDRNHRTGGHDPQSSESCWPAGAGPGAKVVETRDRSEDTSGQKEILRVR